MRLHFCAQTYTDMHNGSATGMVLRSKPVMLSQLNKITVIFSLRRGAASQAPNGAIILPSFLIKKGLSAPNWSFSSHSLILIVW